MQYMTMLLDSTGKICFTFVSVYCFLVCFVLQQKT